MPGNKSEREEHPMPKAWVYIIGECPRLLKRKEECLKLKLNVPRGTFLSVQLLVVGMGGETTFSHLGGRSDRGCFASGRE